MENKNETKRFGFFATSRARRATCKVVNSSFGQGLIQIIHSHCRYQAALIFQKEAGKKAFGKWIPQYRDIVHSDNADCGCVGECVAK